jgi:hypothetical protein
LTRDGPGERQERAMTEIQAGKTRNGGFPRTESRATAALRDEDAQTLQAMREREGASFTELVEDGVLEDMRAAEDSRRRLVRRGLIERSEQRRAVKPRHDCPSCRCDSGGRPRAIYRVVEEEPGA